MAFLYYFISLFIKTQVRSSCKSHRGTSCESCDDLQGIKQNNLSVGRECHKAFNHLSSFAPVNSHLQISLLNPAAFPQLSEYISPPSIVTESLSQLKMIVGEQVKISLIHLRGLTLHIVEGFHMQSLLKLKKATRRKNDYEILFLC